MDAMVKWVQVLLTGLGVIGTFLALIVGYAWIIFFPWAVIWALNELFHMGIAYTFWTWLAMFILVTFVRSKTDVTIRPPKK